MSTIKWREVEKVQERGGSVERMKGDPRRILVSGSSREQSPNTPIEPGASRTLSFSGSLLWAARSFSVPHDLAGRFELVSIRCAMIEWVSDGLGLPCSLFSDASCVACRRAKVYEHITDEWPIVFPGTSLTIVVKNVSDVPSHFVGTFEAEQTVDGIHAHGPCI